MTAVLKRFGLKVDFSKNHLVRDHMNEKSLAENYVGTDQEIAEENEIAEHILGMVAKRDGEPLNLTESLSWQRGWADAQKTPTR